MAHLRRAEVGPRASVWAMAAYRGAMRRRALGSMLVALVATVGVGVPAGAATAPVVLDVRGPSGAIPSGFIGLSVEASAMGSAAFDPAASNLPGALAALGPGILTFAGTSADKAAWQRRPGDPVPRWATATVTPAKLRTIAALATTTGWRVDLGVNLYHDDPARAADEVAAAARILGGSLREVHLGNEPELYSYMYATPVSFDQYVARWTAYRQAIVERTPSVRLMGPDSYLPVWYDQLLGARRVSGSLAEVGDHFYPFSDCFGAGVSAAALLADRSLAKEAKALDKDRALSGALGIPFSFDELNSVSCGSKAPVQWEGASALWAVRALLTAAAGGAAHVGVQTNLDHCQTYSPLCPIDAGRPDVQSPMPIMSALRLVAGLEGGTLLRIRTTSGALPAGASAWAVAMPDGGRRIVLANTSSSAVADVTITGGPAVVTSVTTLSVPDLAATSVPDLVTSPPAVPGLAHLVVPAQTIEVLAGS